MIPELFVMPTPLMVNVNVGLAVIVNALAPELNTMPLTSVLAERETPVVFERANVAVSRWAIGHSGGRPIRCGVPISAAGVEVPGRAAAVEGLDAQHENERHGEKLPHFFHSKHLSGANDSLIHG